MRGEADSCLYEACPAATYYQEGWVESFMEVGQPMKGSSTEGLVLFDPSEAKYSRLAQSLEA